MYALEGNSRGDLRMIIHDQRRGRAASDLVDLSREIDKFVDRFSFSADLD